MSLGLSRPGSGFWVRQGANVRVFGYAKAQMFGFLGTRGPVIYCIY